MTSASAEPQSNEPSESDAEYPEAEWRLLLETAPRPGAENMAVDEAILDAVARGAAPPTLRFYAWAPPCLSLGRRQSLADVDRARCDALGVEVVRRVTGGGAILHTDEFTYSVATTPDDPRVRGLLLDAYRHLSRALIAGLAALDLAAEMQPVAAREPVGVQRGEVACFALPSAYEITVGRAKLIGSAQLRDARRVLQHGSLPLRGDIGRVVECLTFEHAGEREALRAQLRGRATTLDALLGREATFAEVAEAMRRGFAETLRLRLRPGTLTDDEREAVARLTNEKRVAVASHAAIH